jgi:hypothetical protein
MARLTASGVLCMCLVLILSSMFFYNRFSLLLFYSSLSVGCGMCLLRCVIQFLCTFSSIYFD